MGLVAIMVDDDVSITKESIHDFATIMEVNDDTSVPRKMPSQTQVQA